ncbi:IS630 family transposase [Sphaerotilus sp.]|uniref:IS630 family transposase n=1 Tax=Sphaerotilus sp. TaxID=2093942 RepID=UPI002ACED641|nr:IS630 family transposase [Sphaerotilus sp.]MDZ7855608.1 IS630 family transposase [Sphaerotilus sp.]MDZ7856859.1 IS630 family transposase [Sphaerotilus sp.]MDZ7857081.1 IS630 family transposase [Sphaerotilus sp.]
MRKKAEDEELVLAYVDETGFDAVHPNQYAWSPKGERHLIQADRGSRLNVIGAMLSTGQLYAHKLWKTTDSAAFSAFIENLVHHVGKPLTIVMDNASIHTSKLMINVMAALAEKGVSFYRLPAYSPELNRIERLWHKMKYAWMKAKRRDKIILEQDVTEIIDGFGKGKKFELKF